MKITAVIAEYNPFHNGHRYQLEKAREETGADYLLAVMSGDFVQRGVPAFCNKYLRTHMALLGGADAVIELPVLYAASSAEYFAGGAVALLNQLGCIDVLSFGSENGSLVSLKSCSDALLQEYESLDSLLQSNLKKGLSYPAAVSSAAVFLTEEQRLLLQNPNDLLALEYLKALSLTDSSILPHTVKRTGSAYHEKTLPQNTDVFTSATAVRQALASNPASIKGAVPEAVYNFMEEKKLLKRPVCEDDFSALLHYKLLLERENGYSGYLDCTCDLSNKIPKYLPRFTSFSAFCSLLKSKDLTYARISRALLHILLDIRTPDFFASPLFERSLYVPYARLLGFQKNAVPLLSAIKRNSSVPLISKPASCSSLLDEHALEMFLTEVRCSAIYESVAAASNNGHSYTEWTQSPISLTT